MENNLLCIQIATYLNISVILQNPLVPNDFLLYRNMHMNTDRFLNIYVVSEES